MTGHLMETKLRRPRPRAQVVARPRLDELLGRVLDATITLVCAPAGFGKTTLLAQWVEELGAGSVGPSIGWVSLDEHDNDRARFWSYVITAMQRATGSAIGAATLALLSQPPPETLLVPLLNDLEATDVPLVLVLDDYHVIGTPEISDGLTYLIDHLPPHVHLVIATRADPPLPLARLRARGELVEVRAAQLRFTVQEAEQYLSGPMRLTLAPADVAALAARTEGWAAALQLAGLSLQDRDDPSALVARFAGDDRFIVDYLAEEVLARQSQAVRDFLLETSVLERLSGPLCDAVTGQSGGTATLVELERAGLFLVPLDDQRRWWRYHHLFADVLHAHLAEQHPERVAALHRRAARWFEGSGELTAAVDHALAGADFAHAADLMEHSMLAMQRERREPELARWLRELPDDVLRVRPVLSMAFVGVLAQVSDFAAVDSRLRAIERSLRPQGGPWPERPPPDLVVVDEAGWRALPATAQMYQAALDLSRGRLNATAKHARAALTLAPPDADLIRAAAGALGGLASWTVGHLAAARAAYSQSIAGLARAGFMADVLGCSITVGDIHQTEGHLAAALRTYREALELTATAPGARPLRGTADMHVGIASVLVERDDRAAAAAQLASCERLGEHNGLPQHPYRWRVAAARLREANGDLDGALELLDAADRVYNGDYSPNVRPVRSVRARLRLRRGELSEADAWAQEAELSADDELSYLREHEHVTLARLLLARHRNGIGAGSVQQVIALLERLQIAAERGGRNGTLIEVLVLRALAHQAGRDMPAALEALHHAMKLAEPQGYVRVFADEGPAVATLLKALVRKDVDSGYVRRLVNATTRAGRPAPAGTGEFAEPLSDREFDVLRLLATDLDGPDIARQLHVSLNTMRTHSRNIFRKLQVNNRRAAVRQALKQGLLPGQR